MFQFLLYEQSLVFGKVSSSDFIVFCLVVFHGVVLMYFLQIVFLALIG